MTDYTAVGLKPRGEQLKGKWCLVTGASRGVGHKIAEQFALEGANLILVARSKDALEKVTTMDCTCRTETRAVGSNFITAANR